MVKIEALVYMLLHNKRQTPIKDGYRPAFCFDFKEKSFFSGKMKFKESDSLSPGQSSIVEIFFIESDDLKEFLKKGATFSFNEPPNQIGEGEILEIIEN